MFADTDSGYCGHSDTKDAANNYKAPNVLETGYLPMLLYRSKYNASHSIPFWSPASSARPATIGDPHGSLCRQFQGGHR